MIDLLVQSLMVEGSLESAFENAVKDQLSREKSEELSSGALDISNSTPLLKLARELLISCVDNCLNRFHAKTQQSGEQHQDNRKGNQNAIMELLLKLQRLFVGSIFVIFMSQQESICPQRGNVQFFDKVTFYII